MGEKEDVNQTALPLPLWLEDIFQCQAQQLLHLDSQAEKERLKSGSVVKGIG